MLSQHWQLELGRFILIADEQKLKALASLAVVLVRAAVLLFHCRNGQREKYQILNLRFSKFLYLAVAQWFAHIIWWIFSLILSAIFQMVSRHEKIVWNLDAVLLLRNGRDSGTAVSTVAPQQDDAHLTEYQVSIRDLSVWSFYVCVCLHGFFLATPASSHI